MPVNKLFVQHIHLFSFFFFFRNETRCGFCQLILFFVLFSALSDFSICANRNAERTEQVVQKLEVCAKRNCFCSLFSVNRCKRSNALGWPLISNVIIHQTLFRPYACTCNVWQSREQSTLMSRVYFIIYQRREYGNMRRRFTDADFHCRFVSLIISNINFCFYFSICFSSFEVRSEKFIRRNSARETKIGTAGFWLNVFRFLFYCVKRKQGKRLATLPIAQAHRMHSRSSQFIN